MGAFGELLKTYFGDPHAKNSQPRKKEIYDGIKVGDTVILGGDEKWFNQRLNLDNWMSEWERSAIHRSGLSINEFYYISFGESYKVEKVFYEWYSPIFVQINGKKVLVDFIQTVN